MTDTCHRKVQAIEEAKVEIANLKKGFQAEIADLKRKILVLRFIGYGMNLSSRVMKIDSSGVSFNRLAVKFLVRDLRVRNRRGFAKRSKSGTKP